MYTKSLVETRAILKDTGNVLAIAEKGTSTLLMFILNMTPTVVKRWEPEEAGPSAWPPRLEYLRFFLCKCVCVNCTLYTRTTDLYINNTEASRASGISNCMNAEMVREEGFGLVSTA